MSYLNSISTIYEKNLIQEFCDWYLSMVQDAIKNKPIKRKSVYYPDGFEAPVNATGRLHDSLHIERNELTIEVFALAYIDSLVYGQKPGVNVSLTNLEEWANAKGLTDVSLPAAKSNIKAFGNSIWLEHEGANSGLLNDIPLAEKLEALKKDFVTRKVEDVATELINLYQQAA